VYDVVPQELRHPSLGVFGRLDVDTTGLLLLGSDGGLQVCLSLSLSSHMFAFN
jgi:16S rRNA U516 pseudouridylate synthase RsuA-like enzyme